jgi:hypothetical protein
VRKRLLPGLAVLRVRSVWLPERWASVCGVIGELRPSVLSQARRSRGEPGCCAIGEGGLVPDSVPRSVELFGCGSPGTPRKGSRGSCGRGYRAVWCAPGSNWASPGEALGADPVLKHGPRSVTRMRGDGLKNP